MDRFRKQLLEQIERWQAGIATLAPMPTGAMDRLREEALAQIETASPLKASVLAQIEEVRRSQDEARRLGFSFPE